MLPRAPLALGVVGLTAALWLAAPRPSHAAEPPAGSVTFTRDIAPFLAVYCNSCHGSRKKTAGLALDRFRDEASVLKERRTWEKVLHNLQVGEMPPGTRPQPTPAERRKVIDWIGAQFAAAEGKKDPGRVTVRRLNRAEYNNTIRDLLGVRFRPADDFPADDVGYGFDNIGDVLSLPPLLLEKYLNAADRIVDEVFRTPELRRRLLTVQPTQDTKEEAARRILQDFARRAYRRPVTPEEVDRLLRLVQTAEQQGDDFHDGLRLAVQAVLVSPHFLFRIEIDPEPANASAVRPLNDYEMASRLSYFLWSSMPDDELIGRSRRTSSLQQLDTLERQTRRMLKDPKARALSENFAGQWLQTRNLRGMTPDPGLFRDFDDKLREAMQKETELFFEAIVQEDRSVLEFLDSDFTFLNERLARHYGIPGVRGEEFRRVALPDRRRGGVLTQASILTVTSNPTRTSPVKRGKWILENILGTPPPPPPPGAGELSEDRKEVLSGSLRKRMEQHRADPNCATCHQRMDPLGFGFENYDAIGAWRERDGTFPIDPAGTLPDGRAFQSPAELKGILKSQKELFARCLAEKLLTYALGRGLEYYDKRAVDAICARAAQDNYRFSAFVLGVVQSDPFRMRRGQGGEP